MVSDLTEARREHSAEEKVILSVDHHFVLVLAEVQERIEGPQIVDHELFREAELVISLDSGKSEGLSPLYFIPFENCCSFG